MSIPITKATPRAILLGVKDESTRQLPLETEACLLYTSPSPRDGLLSRMPSSA